MSVFSIHDWNFKHECGAEQFHLRILPWKEDDDVLNITTEYEPAKDRIGPLSSPNVEELIIIEDMRRMLVEYSKKYSKPLKLYAVFDGENEIDDVSTFNPGEYDFGSKGFPRYRYALFLTR
jgi:hypothetical protein